MIVKRKYENGRELVWYDSSNIFHSICEDNNDSLKVLTIIFSKGGIYKYYDVDVNDYLMFREGGLDGSQGKAFFKYIKKYKYENIGNCDPTIDYPIINEEEWVNNVDTQYVNLLSDIIENGVIKDDRTGTGTKSIFGTHLKFNLKEGFPLLTGKKMAIKSIIHELIWFLKGGTNIKYLVDNNVSIWNDDAYRYYKELFTSLPHQGFLDDDYRLDKESFIDSIKKGEPISYTGYDDEYNIGDLGRIYGKQWCNWDDRINQINDVIKTLKTNPDDRRMIVSAWNPSDIEHMALPPCHIMFQFFTKLGENGKRELSCLWYQRSVDSFLGLPFNIASYALLTHIIAKICDMEVGELIFNGGDTHLYNNHIDVAKEFIERVNNKIFKLPTLNISQELLDISSLNIDMFEIINYESHSQLKAPLSVGL